MGKSCFAENHDLFYHDGCLAKRTRDIFIMMFSDCDIDQKISPSCGFRYLLIMIYGFIISWLDSSI